MKVLLPFSPIRWHPDVLQLIEKDRDRLSEIYALYVLESELLSRWIHRSTREGWVSEELSRQFYKALLDDFQKRVDSIYQLIESHAPVPVIRLQEEGPFSTVVLNVAERYNVDRIILIRRLRPRWLRRILHTEGREIETKAPCEVLSFETSSE